MLVIPSNYIQWPHTERNEVLLPCRMGFTNDVEHYVLRCPYRRTSRRAGLTVQQIIRKRPEKVLPSLGVRNSLNNPLHLVEIRQGALTVKKKKKKKDKIGAAKRRCKVQIGEVECRTRVYNAKRE